MTDTNAKKTESETFAIGDEIKFNSRAIKQSDIGSDKKVHFVKAVEDVPKAEQKSVKHSQIITIEIATQNGLRKRKFSGFWFEKA